MEGRPGGYHLPLGLATVAFGLLALLLWIPMDTETGILERVRTRIEIGDALAPSAAAAVMVLAGLLLLIQETRRPGPIGPAIASLHHLLVLLAIFACGFGLMRWSGPAVVGAYSLLFQDLESYRNLRDTAPWKFVGYLLGGTFLIWMLMGWAESKLTRKQLAVAVTASLALAAIFDLPFEDLLLPPNGDV